MDDALLFALLLQLEEAQAAGDADAVAAVLMVLEEAQAEQGGPAAAASPASLAAASPSSSSSSAAAATAASLGAGSSWTLSSSDGGGYSSEQPSAATRPSRPDPPPFPTPPSLPTPSPVDLKLEDPTAPCAICLTTVLPRSHLASAEGCDHGMCYECLTAYVQGEVRRRKHPVPCCMAGGGCTRRLPRDTVLAALCDRQDFDRLEVRASAPQHQWLHCPHKTCATPMLHPEGGDLPEGQPAECPACRRAFCFRCNIPGWHKGLTCAQFQDLPPHLRCAEDAAALALAADQGWKRCHACKQARGGLGLGVCEVMPCHGTA
ncbi:hypothetical protein HYH03_000906 [Edaphochlamys debaryana]|uniref:RBR-type E3 ubiquitin transferase n=1 Tax=Edaphochlamys debaryana TaxID=47281 RepID=A0A836C6F8_9CHLO|nr:hypothetical protein HYH03_000906 [Edaphochlamys debaryana]|eukprot:KAG2501088.1 hypothetical protein HYH03_000906 [Edaphochlamys debaryana]